ncbi:ribonuclease [Lasius niger]|uniref:Ribonuclease n=1 Tax=Lasius niger TaxID=67767 RepID=A0A0J7KBI8_LASNI|nr:ribonuclease [Lasius niger]
MARWTHWFTEKPEMLQEMLERIVATEQDNDLTEKIREMLSSLKGGDKVRRLNKAIYGLCQGGRQWHERLDKALVP